MHVLQVGFEPTTSSFVARRSDPAELLKHVCATCWTRTNDLLIKSELLYQLSYKLHVVGVVGLEPTKPKDGRFTVCSRCRWRTPQCRAEAKGFEPLRRFRLPVFKTGAIDQLCQASESFSGAKVNLPNAVFLRNQKNLQKKIVFPKICPP